MRRAAPLLVALVLLVGCAVAEAPPAAELPPVVEQRWVPPEEPRAVMLALHGFNDRKAAFSEFGAYAAARGILVEAYDQPGFGARPDRGRWQGLEVLVGRGARPGACLAPALPRPARLRAGREHGRGPRHRRLHRAHGSSGRRRRPLAPRRSGAATRCSPLYRRALTIAGLVAPWAKLTGGGLGIQASDNIPALIELGQDPLYIRETRIDAIVGLVEAMDEARDRAPLLAVPTLVLTGARDEVVPPQSAGRVHRLPARGALCCRHLPRRLAPAPARSATGAGLCRHRRLGGGPAAAFGPGPALRRGTGCVGRCRSDTTLCRA